MNVKLTCILFLLVIAVIFAYIEDAYAASINLDAEIRGTTILFSWDDVSQTDNVTYYALVLESAYMEAQTTGDTQYLWDFKYGNLSPGDSLVFKIKAYDGERTSSTGGYYLIASDTLTVNILGNGAPQVNAGSDITTISKEEITLRGTVYDPNNDDIEHKWTQLSGPTIITLTERGYHLEFTAPTVTNGEQVLVFKLNATDGDLVGEDTVSVTVKNSRPVADAGSDQTAMNGTKVWLSAGGSSDHDGSLKYLWEQTSGTDVNFSNSSKNISFKTPESASNLVFKLTVNDSQYNATDSVLVRVVENSPPIARILPIALTETGHIVILNGSGTSDPDNDRLMYRWTQINGETVNIINARSSVASFVAPDATDQNRAKFQLAVSDGTFTDKETVTVEFSRNSPPLAYAFGHVAAGYEDIQVGSVYDGADYISPRGVVFVLNGSDSIDQDPLTYQWSQISGADVRLRNANTHTATFNTEISASATLLEFELLVTDTFRNSDTVNLVIAIDGILRPIADAGRDIEARSGTTVTLDGSESIDTAGGDLTYSWAQTSGETMSLRNNNKAMATFTAPSVTNVTKTLSFSLTVETHSVTNTDQVHVNIVPENIKPIADAGSNVRVDGGANVTLDGTGSLGDGLSYDWRQSTGTHITLLNSETATPSFIAPNVTRHTALGFTLSVTDSGGISDTDYVHIAIGYDAPPTSDAGRDIDAFVRSGVTLRGEGNDPEHLALTYLWTQTGGTGVTLSNPDSARTSFNTPSSPGVLSFKLNVMDPGGNFATDRMQVNVLSPTFEIPTVVSDAGPEQTVYVNEIVQLDGESSQGDNLSYSWTKLTGPTITLSGSNIAAPTFTAPSTPSILSFNLTATSGITTDSDTVRINVIAESNDPPTADAGTDKTASPREPVTLAGSGSDPDGDNISYSWTQTSGETVSLRNNNKATASFTAPDSIGMLTFTLTVFDSTGRAGSDSINISIEATLPVADAGPNQIVEPGVTVRLDGSDSYDPDSNRLSYSWTQTSGTSISLSGATSSTPSFRAPTVMEDVLIFDLTVRDGDGNTGTDSVSITVINVEPTAEAGSDQAVKGGVRVFLDGSESIEGIGTTSYLWTQTGGNTVDIDNHDHAVAGFVTPNNNAVLTFKLTVTSGAYSDSDTIRVTIDRNDAPSVVIDADRNVKSGERVELRGQASDPDSTELSYIWSHVSGPNIHINDDRASTAYFAAPDVSGTQAIVIKLVVSDYEGGTNSDTVTINVRENQSPVAVLEHRYLFVATGERGTLDASGSYDPDNDVLSYEWIHNNGPVLSISGSGERVTFIAPAVVSENIVYMTLRVSDGAITDSMGVEVEITDDTNLNAGVPTADAGTDMVVTPGESVTLLGSGSDLDGDRLTYSWTQTSGHDVTLTNSDSASASFTAPNLAGTLTFMLTVYDSNGQSDSDSVNITVEATIPVADAGSSQSVEPGVTVRLDGRDSYDPDSNRLSYSWTQIAGADVSLSGASGSTPSFTSPNVMEDELIFELTVTDNDGNSDTDSVSVTVATLKPTADAGNDQTARSGEYVTLDGDNSIFGIGTSSHLWTQVGGTTVLLQDSAFSSVVFEAPNTDAVLTFKLTVTSGAYSDSDTIRVTINGNESPRADAGADIHAISNETVDLKGFATDPDSIDFIHEWNQVSGPTVHIYNSHTLTPHFIAPEVISGTETIVIKLVVTDYDGGTDSDTITITVSEYISNPN